jgi:hypothetical protein
LIFLEGCGKIPTSPASWLRNKNLLSDKEVTVNTLLGFVIQRPKAIRHHRLSPLLHFTPNFFLLIPLLVSPLLLSFPSAIHAQWEPDRRLTTDTSAQYTNWYSNSWCVSASGDTVHVVWYDLRHGWPDAEIYYKRSTDAGITWEIDTRLTSFLSLSEFPSIAALVSKVHVVWMDDRAGGGNREIYYKRSTDGGVIWNPDVRLTYDSSYSYWPSVAVSGLDVHVVWNDYRDGNFEVYYKRSTDEGFSWNSDVRLTHDTLASMFPCIAASDSVVHVVWYAHPEGARNFQIYYKRSTDKGTSWGLDTRLTNSTQNSLYPTIAVSGTHVNVAWSDSRDGNYEIYTKRSTNEGINWEADTRITYDTANSTIGSIAVSGFNVHVVWSHGITGPPFTEIYYTRSRDGGLTWEPTTTLTRTSVGPSIAISGSKVHVVWYDNRDGNQEIYYKRNPTGNSGVGESSGGSYPLTSNLSFSVVPNPFTSFTTLPGHSSEHFSLYDISGRRVGVWKGDRIGEGLAPGIYFLKSEGKDTKPLRIVKLR